MGAGVEKVQDKIQSFKRKYYLNIFIKGAILSLAILVSYFLLAALLEHALWLQPWARFLIVLTFCLIAAWCVFRFLRQPLSWWLVKRGLNQEQSARIIGEAIPSVRDRLLNLIQLSSSKTDSTLAFASISQKARELEPLAFDSFIDLRQNKKYLRYLLIPLLVVLVILVFNRGIITQSTARIVHFTRQYSPQAPFQFSVAEKSLRAFYNEDLSVDVTLRGDAIPLDVYLLSGDQRIKLNTTAAGQFTHTFENVQQAFDFQLEAAGFYSDLYHVAVASRPELLQFNVELVYPRYVQRQNQKLVNAGNLEVPEGTVVHWKLSAANTEKAAIVFSSDKTPHQFKAEGNQYFEFNRQFRNSEEYEIALQNDESRNREKIAYRVDVIKDQFPQISVTNYRDSILYKRIILGGMVGDDYGVSQLSLHFKIIDENRKEQVSKSVTIPVSKNPGEQSFFYNWSVDSLEMAAGDQLEYYLQVWDNDGINGRKSTKSARYTFLVPTKDHLVTEISRSQSQTEQSIEQSTDRANKLQDKIEQAYQKLKGKQNLDWQDKKMLEDIIEQKQGLDQMIEKLKEENKLLEQKKETFTEQDERIREKAKQIQKLMEELLDEETKKLFEELQKLLEENADMNQIQKLLDKMNQNTNNLEKELERTLELFKELQYDFKLDQAIESVREQAEKQKSLLEKTEALENQKDKKSGKEQNKNGEQEQGNQSSKAEELGKEQEKLLEDSRKTEKQIEELKQLGEELNKDGDLPSEEETGDVQQDQQDSKEMLEQNNPSKSKPSQQKAVQKLQQMQKQMEGAQNSMSMDIDAQNLETLRQIIHGLVKLSFDQEGMMKEFNQLSQSDPKYNLIAQRQLKLRDDAKVLEDSLLALGKRDPFMGSIVTREVGDLNNHLDRVIEANRERKRPQASSEMQMTMTSINNLALMLDDHFDMMMQMMANAQPSMKKSKQKGQKPNLSQMQQQLNQKIQQLKNSGKSGRELSEQLAEMAAEQERIRKALQEMQEKMKEGGKTPGGDLTNKMEQTETDLVNKQLTDQMLRRQQEILTRLLETEKSAREQDMDEERKGETAKDYDKEMPKAFEEYLRLKEKEVELLKTVPPKLYPYYKKEVSEYFKRMGNQ